MFISFNRTKIISLTYMLIVIPLLVSCASTSEENVALVEEQDSQDSVFQYEADHFPDAKPWSSTEFRNDPENFQFAIVGDRTGGANVEGTFRLAMEQVNLLQPEFVINVGDIIEGYTDDKAELNEMWDEAEGMTSKMQMPMFLTPGNHDISNTPSREVWYDRHGVSHYYFIYHDTLFLVLDTEDGSRPEPPEHMKESIATYNRLQVEDPPKAKEMLAEFMKDESIVASLSVPVEFPEQQMDWIKNTLSENADVRWTFLFTHEPCWENPSDSFKEVQGLLADRSFTWFAGHLHYYDYDKIDDKEYITMGPVGASWHHDGPGNVDHLTWVTMGEDGPQIGNIALKGVFDRKGLDPELFGAYDRKGTE